MIRGLALLLSRLAQRALPPGREEWGAAMGAEVEHIGGRLAALAFSVSCIGAALKDRAGHPPSLATAGLWSVALLTTALALFQIGCAVGGVMIALGAPDPYLEALLQGTPEQRSIGLAYRQATPTIVLCLMGAGLAQLLGAFFLVRQRRQAFVHSSWFALGCCIFLGGAVVWIGVGREGLPIQLSALVLQAIAVPLLWQLLPLRPQLPMFKE